ncbi:hypothetical protein DUI87_03937 [Hirundo rustica rustica]|uniref:Uncharacterized protein n=1 Tax=Hirundo rustica rustica TaxID=333673 RepID=A0A3M0L1E4_HIRRU|nr:hypothetical protein DUI87_03937 [Hirundo rustica rustica]
MTQSREQWPRPRGPCSPSEGPRQGGEVGREELSELQQRQMQGPALGRSNPRHQHGLRADLLGSSSEEKDLGFLVDSKLSMSQQWPYGQKSHWCPGVHQEEHCQQDVGGDPAPLLSPGEAHQEFCVERRGEERRGEERRGEERRGEERRGEEREERRGGEERRGEERRGEERRGEERRGGERGGRGEERRGEERRGEERRGERGEERRGEERRGEEGDFINVYKYLKEGCKEDRANLFLVVSSNRKRGSRQKTVQRKFYLYMRKNQVTMHWHRLSREVVDSLSMQILQNWLNPVLCNML